MTDQSKQRIVTEQKYLKVQTQFLLRNRIISEAGSVSQNLAANTVRLRELRLAKEAADRRAAQSNPAGKKTRRNRAA